MNEFESYVLSNPRLTPRNNEDLLFSAFFSTEISWVKIQICRGGAARGVLYSVCLVTSLQIIHALLEPRSHSALPPWDGGDWVLESPKCLMKWSSSGRSCMTPTNWLHLLQDHLLQQTGLPGPLWDNAVESCRVTNHWGWLISLTRDVLVKSAKLRNRTVKGHSHAILVHVNFFKNQKCVLTSMNAHK